MLCFIFAVGFVNNWENMFLVFSSAFLLLCRYTHSKYTIYTPHTVCLTKRPLKQRSVCTAYSQSTWRFGSTAAKDTSRCYHKEGQQYFYVPHKLLVSNYVCFYFDNTTKYRHVLICRSNLFPQFNMRKINKVCLLICMLLARSIPLC